MNARRHRSGVDSHPADGHPDQSFTIPSERSVFKCESDRCVGRSASSEHFFASDRNNSANGSPTGRDQEADATERGKRR